MKKILILGGGFGGLLVAERLSKEFEGSHQITLVSPQPTFTFYPALVRLAFGEISASDVTFDLAKKLHDLQVRFVEGEVLHLKPEFGRVQIAGKDFNGDLSYDYLVIATGRRLATEKLYGFYDHSHHLLGVEAAEKFGKAIDDFTQGSIVVGLAPGAFLPVPVCETAFALANRLYSDSPKKPVNITVAFPETIDKAFGGAEISKELRNAFARNQIEVIEDFAIDSILPKKLVSKNDKEIPFDLLMVIPPFRGQARFFENRITDESNFIEVDRYMRVEGMKNAYAVGDIVSYPGPKLAHIAVDQANIAAANIVNDLAGQELEEIYYHDIATIIDQGGSDSIYLHYGFWDESVYRLRKGTIWSLVKRVHDRLWKAKHKSA